MVISKPHIKKAERWLFIIPPYFLAKQDAYKRGLGYAKLVKSYEDHKKRFEKDPLRANDAHPLKYDLRELRSADCCSGDHAHAGDRVIFFRTSKHSMYLVDIVCKHDYKHFVSKAKTRFGKKWRDTIKAEYKKEIEDFEKGL